MGKAQSQAIGHMKVLYKQSQRTHAAICVRDRANNVWAWNLEGKHYADKEHVEEMLIKWLAEKYAEGLPNYAIVVIYIDKSPCMDCTNKILAPYMQKLKSLSSQVQLKVFFS